MQKKFEAIIYVIKGTQECSLMDIVLPIDNVKVDRIKGFRRIPIVVLAEETWSSICKKKAHMVEIKQTNNMKIIKHENVIVELGKEKKKSACVLI